MEIKLTKEAVHAINTLMHEFRYDFEGPRDTDSIEEWVDKWLVDNAIDPSLRVKIAI